jgi:REP element-mobilizing transposase RayT
MEFDPGQHHRRSIRLRGFDYSQRGIYFVTICTHKNQCVLGRIVDSTVVLTDAGWAVRKTWLSMPERFPGIVLDRFVVMPNHIHGVIAIVRESLRADRKPATQGAASSAPPTVPSLGAMIRAFKSVSAIEINCISGRHGHPVWQRNYYEHIVRDGRDLQKIFKYMAENPVRWESDQKNPASKLAPLRS